MALQKLVFKPGVNRDQTNYANEGGWYECNKVRFFSGFPQIIGGWTRYSTNPFRGTCRSFFNWANTTTGLIGDYLAIGTSSQIYVENYSGAQGYLQNITPLRGTSPSIAISSIDTVITSSVITVNTSSAHSAAVGNYVTLGGITGPLDTNPSPPPATLDSIKGIPLSVLNSNNGYKILSVPSTTSLTIDVSSIANANASVTPTGTPLAYFEISVGAETNLSGSGWGIPPWNGTTTPQTGWGTAALTPAYTPLRLIYFDKYVDNTINTDLFFNIRFSNIYYWDLSATYTPSTRAKPLDAISGANSVPTLVTQILFDSNANILMAFGCEPYEVPPPPVITQDPLLIRWASQADFRNWAPSDDPGISTAGYLRIQNGSKILRALSNANEILVFTDSAITSVQFTGSFPLLFTQRLISADITVIAPNAVAAINNVIYWMGHDKFFLYNGRVEVIPTTLRDEVFTNINYEQSEQFFACTNERFNEIWWFYISGGSLEINRYVVYNYVENIWHYGDCSDGMVRTAWIDSSLRPFPQAASSDGYIYNHEDGTSADGEAFSAFITSSDVDIEDGERFSLVRRIIPDISFNGSTYDPTLGYPTVSMTLYPHNFPGAPYMTVNQEGEVLERPAISLLVNQYTEQLFVRTRARQIGIKISSDSAITAWQLGAPRIEIRPDGLRGYTSGLSNNILLLSNTTDGTDITVINVDNGSPPPAPLFFLDASNSSSWPYSAGSAPVNANWTDIGGSGKPPGSMDVVNNPDLVTISGSTKGLRMKATTGGTYPNGTAVEQRGYVNLGGPTYGGSVGRALYDSLSYTVSMWICFNQAPISGSGTGGTDMPTTILAQYTGSTPYLIFSSSRGDSVQPRYLNEIAVQYYSNAPSSFGVSGTWVPTVGVWYLVTIVCENTSSSSGTLNLYINNTLQGTSTITGATNVPFTFGAVSDYTWHLNATYFPGASPNPYQYGGDITFSTFKIWDSALSASNIVTMFNSEKTPFGY